MSESTLTSSPTLERAIATLAQAIPASAALAPGSLSTGSLTMTGSFAAAALSEIEGAVSGRLAILVSADLVTALENAPGGPLKVSDALQPAFDAFHPRPIGVRCFRRFVRDAGKHPVFRRNHGDGKRQGAEDRMQMLIDQAGQDDLVLERLVDREVLRTERCLDLIERAGRDNALAGDRDGRRFRRGALHGDDFARNVQLRRRGCRDRRRAKTLRQRFIDAAVGARR